MRPRRLSLFAALASLAVLSGEASVASACTCVPPDFYNNYTQSDAIFLGEVLEISSAPEDPYSAWVTFRVDQHWKGDPEATTRVLNGPATCGFPFRVGNRYLIYAYRFGDQPPYGGQPIPGELGTNLCTGTHLTWPGDPDIDLLNAGPPSRSPNVLALAASPNPSRGPISVAWTIPSIMGASLHRARLDVLDSQGRRVVTLKTGPVFPGTYRTTWDGRDERGHLMPPGLYWARLEWAGQSRTRKIVRIGGGS